MLVAVGSALGGAPVAAQRSPAAEPPRFDILEFVVEGDTLLGAPAIERAVYRFLGPQRSAADAEAARKALEQAYQDAGFLSVSVLLPPQRVDGGEVKLQVVPAAVERLRVTGAQFHLPSEMSAQLPSLAEGSVPNFAEMQQELAALARARGDVELTPIVGAGLTPGTLAVELKVADSAPLHGFAEVNSKQSVGTMAGRLEAGLSYDNLFQRGHSLGVNWFYAPRRPAQANIQSLVYHLPLGGAGDRLFAVFTHSDSNTPTPLGGATVSRGNTARLRWRDELPRRDDLGLTHALTWGATVRRLRDRNDDVAGASVASPELRYTTFSAGYEIDVTPHGGPRSTRLTAEVNVSPGGLNRRSVDCGGVVREQFACKRADAAPGFQVLTLGFSHREPLGRWLVAARLQGQYSDAPLVPAEQVVYGGQDSVRGYYEGEQAGDLGAAARFELVTPNWAPAFLGERGVLRLQAFYDRALLRRLYALPQEARSTQLASAGLGLRVNTGFGLSLALDVAELLRDTRRADATGVQQPLSGSAAGRERRVDFSLRQTF